LGDIVSLLDQAAVSFIWLNDHYSPKEVAFVLITFCS